MVLCMIGRLGPAVGVVTKVLISPVSVALVILPSTPVGGRRVGRKLLQRMDLPRLCSSVRLVEDPHPAAVVWRPPPPPPSPPPHPPVVACVSTGRSPAPQKPPSRCPGWVCSRCSHGGSPCLGLFRCYAEITKYSSTMVILPSVLLSSRCVSIAVLVPATRRKGSGHDEPVALGVGPLSPVPVVLDHLLLSCRQVYCNPHSLSRQLLLAFGQGVHFVRPLGKLGYYGL